MSATQRTARVTLTGKDKPGILNSVIDVFDTHNAQLLDIDQIVLNEQVTTNYINIWPQILDITLS